MSRVYNMHLMPRHNPKGAHRQGAVKQLPSIASLFSNGISTAVACYEPRFV